MSTKHGSMTASVLLIPTIVQSISKIAFLPLQKVCKSCVIGLQNIIVTIIAWNLPVSIGFLFSNIFYQIWSNSSLFFDHYAILCCISVGSHQNGCVQNKKRVPTNQPVLSTLHNKLYQSLQISILFT